MFENLFEGVINVFNKFWYQRKNGSLPNTTLQNLVYVLS
jgi:hypothetical protein